VTASIVASALVTLAMALVVALSWRAWSALDQGARPIAVGVGVSLLGALISLGFVLRGRETRPIAELLLLIETSLVLWGMAAWQTGAGARRVLRLLVPIWALVWLGAQFLQGLNQPFSPITAPIGHTLKVGAAGYTLIIQFRATEGAWTRHLWFWFCTGIMLMYGTEIFLDPLWQRVFQVRDDLVFAAFFFNLIMNAAGYALMAWGLFRVLRPAADSRA